MAAHLFKYEAHQRTTEAGAFAVTLDENDSRRDVRRAGRTAALSETKEKRLFLKTWVDTGTEDWEANQRVKLDRQQVQLSYELAMLEKQRIHTLNRHGRENKEVRDGCDWFERNMKRLGVGGDEDLPDDEGEAMHRSFKAANGLLRGVKNVRTRVLEALQVL